MSGRSTSSPAPSGAGKSSLVNALLERAPDPNIRLSISFTSRAPRPGEPMPSTTTSSSRGVRSGWSRAGEFFEHALVHGDWKGTARQSVEPQLAAGRDVLLEIDWQGARQVRAQVPDCGQRVHPAALARGAGASACASRGQDSEETIARRLAAAREEMSTTTSSTTDRQRGLRHRRRRDVRDLHRQPPAPAGAGAAPCRPDRGLLEQDPA
jgi:guanylate kinase